MILMPWVSICKLSLLVRNTRLGLHPSINPRPPLRWDFLVLHFLRDKRDSLMLNPASLEDLDFSVRVFSLSWYVPIYASETCVSSLHGLAVLERCPGAMTCTHTLLTNKISRGDAVGIVTRLLARRKQLSISHRGNIFSLLHNRQTGTELHPAS
jgi:hypothetical protein